MSADRVAVIVDIVDSKKIGDRTLAQAEIMGAFARVDSLVKHTEALRPTVGDEFQAVYATVADALEATLLARLVLPVGIDCRFGLGRGGVRAVGDGANGPIQDGSGWWLAREAIDEAHRRESSRTPTLRGWFRSDGDSRNVEALVNAYLLSRDHIVSGMNPRARRLALGAMLGVSQSDLAMDEGVTQSAVSQALHRSGAVNLIVAISELRGMEL
jgi:hypothetical protein